MLKKMLKWVWEVLEVFIIIYVIFITSCILCRNKYGYTQFDKYIFVTVNEENQKLLPKYDIGDLLIIKEQKFNINKGDVVYYYLALDEKYVVRTGVVDRVQEDDFSALYVLNDESNTAIADKRILGKYVSVHPKVGSLLETLESRIGFLFFVLLPILIVFIYQVYQLVVVAKYEVVEDEDTPVKEEKTIEKKSNKDEIELL